MSTEAIGIAAAIGAGGAWALGAVLFKSLAERVPPLGLTFVKGALGLVFLGGLLALDPSPPVSLRTSLVLGASGLLGIALGDTFFFATLQRWPAHLVVLLGLGGQALVVLLATAVLGETLSATEWTGVALIALGIGLAVVRKREGTAAPLSRKGWAFGLLSVATMSGSVLIAKVGLHDASALQGTFIRLLWGTGGALIIGLALGRTPAWWPPFRESRLRRELLAAVLVGTVGGFWLFHLGLKNTDASIANTLTATEPLLVLPLAAFILREPVQRRAVLGAAVAVVGVALLYVGVG